MKVVDSFGDTLHINTEGGRYVTIEVEYYAGSSTTTVLSSPIEIVKEDWDSLVQQVAKELK